MNTILTKNSKSHPKIDFTNYSMGYFDFYYENKEWNEKIFQLNICLHFLCTCSSKIFLHRLQCNINVVYQFDLDSQSTLFECYSCNTEIVVDIWIVEKCYIPRIATTKNNLIKAAFSCNLLQQSLNSEHVIRVHSHFSFTMLLLFSSWANSIACKSVETQYFNRRFCVLLLFKPYYATIKKSSYKNY